MPEVQYKVDLPAFTGRNVPFKDISVGKVANIHRRSLLLVGVTLGEPPADLAQTMAHWM